ncbi:MAG: NAD(P)-dependent oxidoreductase [Candidatus Acidiferrum sp.]|jgi:3-hydroxyisobutyrate dehydrogenase
MAKPCVAILGLGIMGSGMARRLLSANFPLAVYNRSREKCLPLAEAGAFVAATPGEAASRAQIIISVVANDAASSAVWLGEEGALSAAAANSILIESSTLSIGWVRDLAAKATRRGCQFLDAPVTGSKPQAASGELLFLVGGSTDALEAARPVFSVLGRGVVHLGASGSGALMKLINNFLCGVQAASFAEAVSLIDAGGLDRVQAMSILTGGAPGSGILKRVAERISANDFTPNFALRWMAKDLSYALEGAAGKGVSLPVATAALAVFQKAIADGRGDQDFSAVTKSPQRDPDIDAAVR